MAALAFFGLFFLGLGPGIVFYCFFIAPRSFVVLLTLFSAFFWLVVLLLTSAILRGFVPISQTASSYAGVLVATVVIEEVARYGVWHLHRRTVQMLEGMSRASGHAFTQLDRLYLALGWGYGHGACHALFFFASLLPLTVGEGTYYTDACPHMSVFLVAALNSLGFGAALAALMVVALDGWHSGSVAHIALAPATHLALAMLTLANFVPGGCLIVAPIIIAIGACTTAYAGSIAWRKGRPVHSNSVLAHLQG